MYWNRIDALRATITRNIYTASLCYHSHMGLLSADFRSTGMSVNTTLLFYLKSRGVCVCACACPCMCAFAMKGLEIIKIRAWGDVKGEGGCHKYISWLYLAEGGFQSLVSYSAAQCCFPSLCLLHNSCLPVVALWYKTQNARQGWRQHAVTLVHD